MQTTTATTTQTTDDRLLLHVRGRCRHNCAFIKWDDKDHVDYGELGDWRWWWHLKPEAP